MNTEIIIHTGEYAGGIEDGEILFQSDENVNFIPNVGGTLYVNMSGKRNKDYYNKQII